MRESLKSPDGKITHGKDRSSFTTSEMLPRVVPSRKSGQGEGGRGRSLHLAALVYSVKKEGRLLVESEAQRSLRKKKKL